MKAHSVIQKVSVLSLFSLVVGVSVAGQAQSRSGERTYVNFNEYDTTNGGSERLPGYDDVLERPALPKGLVYDRYSGQVVVARYLNANERLYAEMALNDYYARKAAEAEARRVPTYKPEAPVDTLANELRYLRDQVDTFKPVELNHILPNSPLSIEGKRKFLKESFSEAIVVALQGHKGDKYDTSPAKKVLASKKWMPQFFQVVATETAAKEADGLLAYFKKEGIESQYVKKVNIAATLESMNNEKNYGFKKASQHAALNTFIGKAGFKILSATVVLGLAGGAIAADAGSSVAPESSGVKQGAFSVRSGIPTTAERTAR